MDERTAHDFSTENIIIFALSGFIAINTNQKYFSFNMIYKACQLCLYGFFLVLAVYTMSIASDDKITMVRAFHSLCLALLAVVYFSAKHFTDGSLNQAIKSIKDGIFKYSSEGSSQYDDILVTRVAQIRLANSAFKKLLVSSAMVYIFIFPLVKKLTLQDSGDTDINPYLPLTLYMPFNTRTYLGFISAFASIAAFYVILFLSGLCALMIYTSCAIQLIAHIEVLNISLIEIERRAVTKFMKNFTKNKTSSENLYKKIEFQNCLYSCLRENILHHHAILRFKKAVSPFLEALNGILLVFFSATMAEAIFLILEGTNSDVTMVAFLITEIAYYLLISLIGQTITDKSSETAHSLYATPWPDCDGKFKLLMKIMAAYLRNPIYLKTSGFSGASSLETFGDMMSVGYKLTSVLR